jgi:hypothetical protein
MSPDVRRDRWWLGVTVAVALACRACVGILTGDEVHIAGDLRPDAWLPESFRTVESCDPESRRTTEVYERRDANGAPRRSPRS